MNDFDSALISIFEKILDFFNDWLAISQKKIEKFCLGAYLIISVLSDAHFKKPWMISSCLLCTAIIFLGMYSEYKEPAARRKFRRFDSTLRSCRLGWIWVCLFYFCLLVVPPYTVAIEFQVGFFGLSYIFRTMGAYITICNVEGEKGRKAKLAWSKIREFFGTSWVPQPVGV